MASSMVRFRRSWCNKISTLDGASSCRQFCRPSRIAPAGVDFGGCSTIGCFGGGCQQCCVGELMDTAWPSTVSAEAEPADRPRRSPTPILVRRDQHQLSHQFRWWRRRCRWWMHGTVVDVRPAIPVNVHHQFW